MKITLTTLLLATALAGSALAQSAPVGGPDAKGNAPIKHAHTVNDGAAKPGANSFTMGQAMRHIEHSGYTGVNGLVQGNDGVWRGMAMKNGAPVSVAMDFKGNVSQGMTAAGATSGPRSATAAPMAAPAMASESMPTRHMMHHRYRHHHHVMRGCATNPGPNGVACSGRDRNRNGISDKEDRAIANH